MMEHQEPNPTKPANPPVESPAISEQPDGNNSPPNSEEDGNDKRETSEPSDKRNDQCLGNITENSSDLTTELGSSQSNLNSSKGFVEVYKLLITKYENLLSNALECYGQDEKEALELIESEKGKFRDELEKKDRINQRLESEKRKLEEDNRRWHERYNSQRSHFERNILEKDNPIRSTGQSFETNSKRKFQDFQAKYDQIAQENATIKQQNENLEGKVAELEATRDKLLAETASLKRNTGTHYDGTSARPQHHVLTGEYKTLKEQHLDPLATSLFNFLATSNPDFKQQRKQKLNDIKAEISATVLIRGQAIMQGDSIASVKLPSGTLEEMQDLFCRKLEINNHSFSSPTKELLKKEVSLALGKDQYPVLGKWQDEDFQHVSTELSAHLYQVLKLDITSLSQELETEVQKAIQKALRFLERAAFADPPACLNLDNEDDSFDSNYHEAAKGWDDEGTVIKAIYPVYLVNGEAKVKAVVLTKKSDSGSSDTWKTSNSTQSDSNSLKNKPNSTGINEDEKKKMIRLEAKRESLIHSVKSKWFETPYSPFKNQESVLTEKLSKIEQLDIIETLLEKEIHKVSTIPRFKKKLDELLTKASSQ